FTSKPYMAFVRNHSTVSGLNTYGGRVGSEWPQVARQIFAAEKPNSIIMMIANCDRQVIREKAPPVVRPAPPKGNPPPAQAAPSAAPKTPPSPVDPEQQPSEHSEAVERPANVAPGQVPQPY